LSGKSKLSGAELYIYPEREYIENPNPEEKN
jgi:hypothetical protein